VTAKNEDAHIKLVRDRGPSSPRSHRAEQFLKRFIPAESQRHTAEVITLGLVQDHVHIVLRLPAHFDLPRLVQGLKGASARLANQDESISKTGLRWDAGYRAVSIGRQQLPVVVAYVRNQARRHPDRKIETNGSPGVCAG